MGLGAAIGKLPGALARWVYKSSPVDPGVPPSDRARLHLPEIETPSFRVV